MSVVALIVHDLNVVQIRVCPVNQPADQVQCDAVREDDLTVHELSPVLTVHVAALHRRDRTVVCEEHLPEETKELRFSERDGIIMADLKAVIGLAMFAT